MVGPRVLDHPRSVFSWSRASSITDDSDMQDYFFTLIATAMLIFEASKGVEINETRAGLWVLRNWLRLHLDSSHSIRFYVTS